MSDEELMELCDEVALEAREAGETNYVCPALMFTREVYDRHRRLKIRRNMTRLVQTFGGQDAASV